VGHTDKIVIAPRAGALASLVMAAVALLVAGCGSSSSAGAPAKSPAVASSSGHVAPKTATTTNPAAPASAPAPSPSHTYAWQQPSGAASSAAATPSPSSDKACTVFTPTEMSAILGTPVQATKAAPSDAHGDYCVAGAGPVQTASGLRFHVLASIQLTCPPQDAAGVWRDYVTSGQPVKGDPRIRSLSGTGTNDAIQLRHGCTLSSTVGLSGSTGNVVPGSPHALQRALEGAYNRS
jgi:hypothetical protein